MLCEIVLLGLAYFGSKKLKENGETVKMVMELGDAVKSIFQEPPPAETLVTTDAESHVSPEQQSLEALYQHYKDVSIFSTGALTAGKLIPLAGPLGTVAYIYALAPHLRSMEETLRKNRRLDADCLFLFADILALLSGSYVAAAFSLYLIQAGKLGIIRAKDSSRKHLQHFFKELPSKVWIARDGIEIEVPLKMVQQGDIVVLHGGTVIPVDGVITEGFAGIDQQALTGESEIAEKGPGDLVFASTILINGKINVQVSQSGSETTANQIAEILFKSVSYKSESQMKGEKWADQLISPMFYSSLALLPFIGPVSTSVFINAHIGVRIRILAPMGTLKHIGMASRKGLLVKDGRALEKFLDIDTILFDKTGTLTFEEPEVGEIILSDHHTEEEIVRYAAIAEQKLAHPIARAILSKARDMDVSFPDIDGSCYSIGYGIKVDCSGEIIQAGSLRYLEGEKISVPDRWHELQNNPHYSGSSFIFLSVDNQIIGAIQLKPRMRHDMHEVIARLRQQGIKYMAIVSGDMDLPTRLLAEELGMDGYFANVLPQRKAEIVTMLQAEGKKVCFIGDGINDSIALKHADVSISLAGASTIAKDMAEIVLMDGHIGAVNDLHDISAALDKNLKQCLQLSVAPGAINLVGAFVFNFNVLASLLVNAAFGVFGARLVMPSTEESSADKK